MSHPFAAAMVMALVLPAASFAAPAIRFESAAVIAEGFPARAEVVLFALASEPHGHYLRVTSAQTVLRDDDGDGAVRYVIPPGVQPRSVWCAADIATGEHVIAAPPGFGFTRLTLADVDLRRDSAGQVNALRFERRSVEILLVRPGDGAWRGTYGEGSPSDDDGEGNASLLASPIRLRPISGNVAVPSRFRNDDLVIVIDSDRFDVLALQVGRP